MLVGEKTITFEEYMKMPIGAPYQLINGCLIDWPSRTPMHQVTSNGVLLAIGKFEEKNSGGLFIMGPIETIFDDQNSFQPDFVYIAADRLEIVKDYVYGPPDLVIEVLWKQNAYYDLRPKKDIYEKYGVKEYIIIDPMAKDSDLYALKDGKYCLHQKAQAYEQIHSLILPGLIFDLQRLFKFDWMNEHVLGAG